MHASHQIACRHFGRDAVAVLRAKGLRVTGLTAVPDAAGSFLRSETAYLVDDNGTGRVLSYAEVAAAARAA